LITSSLAVLGMQAFMQWSFRHGLTKLAQARERERLEQIRERLTERYTADGGWHRLAADRRLWIATLASSGDRAAGERPWEPPPRSGPGPAFNRHLGPDPRDPGAWPPAWVLRRAREGGGPPLHLEMRLMLLDTAGEILYGRPELLAKAVRFPLSRDGEPIGELAVLPGPLLPEARELRFRKDQTMAFLVIAAGTILLSAVFALPLSARLSRPVLGFRDTARRLAAGDFRARVHTTGEDEIGRLGRDINALAETLERNEHARRRWVADISHELRTPLALLRAEIEALQDGVRPVDAGALEALHGDVLRLGRLVDDLYELSMADLGALSYRKEEVDLAAVLEDDLASFADKFAAAGIDLQFDHRLEAPALLSADGHRLSQLFRNLLRNSLAYTDRGGSLAVTLDLAGGYWAVDFDDTAPGVPPAALPHLFERLYRVEGSRSRNLGGAGLGLAICKNIVEAHGGTIEAHPSTRGGLLIRIRLPRAS